ncbi:GRIP domain [Nesidiocoris tenuis]|uniref:GRIP domain n=1 Tax=Nesidiocoris tenuis TaxID=355587 RepID=A0ABN7ASU8_9HEMI|nr:GRIP domain [Nesidiocoris tenuis]
MEGSSKAEPVGSSQGELTREKLTQKCKSLLAIAQKAKISRDEALEEKGKLQKALEDTKSAMTAKDNQFKAVEEMLGVLTDQKLKLAMDIDTLKKEKAAFASQFKQLSDEKERFEAEALSMKRQYDRLLTENEDLIGELQLRERSEKQLLSDIKKLHENNESVKILCTNVTHEKLRLEEDLEKLSRETEALRQERNNWNLTLSKKYGFAKVDLESLVEFVDKKIKNSQAELTEKLEFENDESLAEVLDQLDKAKKENDLMEEEAKSMKEKIQRLMSELETANVDRDKMMANLEDVRIETKTLIENVDKLSEEVDSTKMEKLKSENALHKIIESKNGEIDALLQELSKNKAYVNELMASMNSRVAKGDKSAELPLKLKSIEEEIEPMKKREDEPLNDKSSKDTDRNSSRAVESSILKILKEGICSNLSDLKDTMPEYSKEFLDKLNSIIEGADCKGEIGADVFVHYFNECLSQLKISLKENEILTKELSHQKGSIKELEGLVEKHNTDCEQLRSEVEELSADSNRLLHDLGNLRQENLLRVSEIGELMVRLKQRNDDVDRLKEINNRLENEHNEQISSLRSEIAEANNRLSHLQEQKQELDKKLAATMSESEAVKNELESSLEDIKSLKAELENEKISNHEWTVKSDELLRENETLKEDIQQYTEDIANLNRRQEDLNAQLSQKSAELKNVLKRVEAMSAVEDELKQLKIASEEKHVRSLEAEKLQEENEALRTNLNELKAALISKQSELDQVHLDLRDANDRLSVISSELEKSKLIISENEELKNEIGSQLAAKDEQLQSLEALLKKGAADADGLRATVDQLQTELKAKSIDLQKLNQELEAKSSLEDELSKLRDVLQKTVEEVDNSKKLAEQSQGRVQELEAALNSKHADVERMENETRQRGHVEVEFQKLEEELRSKLVQTEERLRLAVEENDSLKKKIVSAEEAFRGKIAELDIVQEQLRSKELIEEQLSAAEARLQNLTEVNERVALLEKESDGLKSKIVELEQQQQLELKEAELRKIETSEQQKVELLQESDKLVQTQLAERDSSIAELERRLVTAQDNLARVEATAKEEARKNEKSTAAIAEMSETVECLQSENDVLREKLKSQAALKEDELKARNADIEKLNAEMEGLKEMLNFKKLELDEINCVWAGRLNSLKVNLNSLGRSMRELGRLAVQLQETFLEKVLQLKNDFSFKTTTVLELSAADAKRELLDEMHRMNEVLKDRGNSISNLQDLLSEAVAKSSSYKSQIGEIQAERNKALADLKDKEDKLAAAESSVKELESELSRLKELKESAPENDSLSTSTISRTEEHMRFKEVDDSIEEKYVKLRQVAVKLKKKSSELTQTLEQERSKFTNDRAELVDKIQHLSTVAKNAQKVQESYDKALDELETLRKQSQTSSAAMKELTAKEESLKRRVATLESQNANIPLMAKQIDGLNHTIKDLKAEISRTEMEKKVEVMKYEEVKRQCTALESKSVSLTQSLDQAVQQGRATNVLELEINNYEKVISDLTTQLNAEKQKLANSEKEYASVSLVKNGLEEQIALLEEQVRAEESRNANLQEQMTSMRDKTTAAQQRADELNDQVAALRRDLQQAKNNNEQQAFEMSSLSSDFSRKEIDLQNRIDSFTAHIQSLETTLATIKQELATSNSEKEHLREEFECYRLRAQTMLARQKGDSVSHGEKEAREQLDKLKKELDSAREKMENNQTETETLNNKLSSLQLEKARSDKRYEDVTKALHQKITDYDSLNTEYRAFKFSAETLLQNTKVEFEERVRQLKAENSSLKELVETLSRKSELDSAGFDLAPGPDFKNNNSSERQFEAIQAQDGAAVHLLEREDGEGSESVPPPLSNYRRLSNLVPLDILLNNPIDDENRIPVLQEQIEKLHGELHSYEVRVKHLASLLSEAEKDAARSSQQNAVLKEELRRLERSLQREPNIANSEYLKNVIFKFLVLQSGDERTRLVPVLDTILKLSPDETSKLTAVAKGDSATWGSYLHSWTGL